MLLSVSINMQVSLNDNTNNEVGHGNRLGSGSVEMDDRREIDSTLDEFSRMLSDYGCDDNPADHVAPTAAQTRIEAVFVPPDRTDSSLHHLPAAGPFKAESVSDAAAAKGNPSTPAAPTEDEASVR